MSRIIVVGGGPAGLMAAIRAAEKGASVTLLEKMPSAARKLATLRSFYKFLVKRNIIGSNPEKAKELLQKLKLYIGELRTT